MGGARGWRGNAHRKGERHVQGGGGPGRPPPGGVRLPSGLRSRGATGHAGLCRAGAAARPSEASVSPGSPGSFRSTRVSLAASMVLLALISVCAACLRIRSYDVWWHMETGEQILHRLQIPRVDDFTFTSIGRPWVDHEWLAQVGMYLMYASLGTSGLTLLKATCAFGAAAIGYLMRLRLGGGAGVALALAAVSVAGMRGRLGERPESLTLLMSCAALALLLDLTASPASPGRRLAAMFGLSALWANLHAGALLAPALALACCAGALVEIS